MTKHAVPLALMLAFGGVVPTRCSAQQHVPYPPGVYGNWLLPDQISTSGSQCVPTNSGQKLVANKGLVGILLYATWPEIDTGTSGPNLQWDTLNQRLAEAQACGLAVALTLPTALTNLPVWVQQQSGIQRAAITGIGTVPVYWDATFNNDRIAFIQAAAADIATLPAAVSDNIVAVVAQPFGMNTDDWNIAESAAEVADWKAAGYNTTTMLSTGERFIDAVAASFPAKNLKLPVQADSTLDSANDIVALAQQVLSYAYGQYSGRFYAQINSVGVPSPVNCVSPCNLDKTTGPYALFNLLRQYQSKGYGVGLQDVDGATQGAAPGDNCHQNGGPPCTPCDTPPVQYSDVAQKSWNVVATYKPTYWEIWQGDALTLTGAQSTCPITTAGQAAMIQVYSAATAEMRAMYGHERRGVTRVRQP